MSEELSQYANYELGEAFFFLVNSMLTPEGIPYPDCEDFDFISPSWRKLASKEKKSADDLKKIDELYKSEVINMADSCILYMAAKLKKKDYVFNQKEFKEFIKIVDKSMVPNDSVTLNKYNSELDNMFLKIANHGELQGDNLIDKKDWASYVYALDLESEHNEKAEFTGFNLNGKINARNYAVMYNLIRKNEDNMASFKLREAYKNLYA